MKKAALYQRSNGLQRFDAQNVLNEYAYRFQSRSNESESLLDVGCGSGDITMDLVLPILPLNFKRLVGCDLSQDMVDFARKKHKHANISFEQFDLGTDIGKQALKNADKFEHITSFYCLMWVHDSKIAVENLYKLLKPGGDMLLVFLAQHPMYDFYKKQSQDIRWEQYMTDVDEFITPYQYSKKPADEFRSLLKECGFIDCDVEAREKCYVFNGVQPVISMFKRFLIFSEFNK